MANDHLQMPSMPNGNSPTRASSMGPPNQKQIQAIVQRIGLLRSQGLTAENSDELQKLYRFIQMVQQQHRPGPQPPVQPEQGSLVGVPELTATSSSSSVSPHHTAPPNGIPPANGINHAHQINAAAPVNHGYLPHPPSPVHFNDNQVATLRAQITAFRHISRGVPLPDAMLATVFPIPPVGQHPSGAEVGIFGEAGLKDGSGSIPTGPFLEDQTDSGIYPYNAYTRPSSYLLQHGASAATLASRQQRLFVPSLLPPGLDPHQVIAERNRFIDARIRQRILELSSMPSTMGEGGWMEPPVTEDPQAEDTSVAEKSLVLHRSGFISEAHGKTRAMIELKALSLLNKQRSMRAQMVQQMTHGSLIPVDRKELRRYRKPTMRDVRGTEALERKQRQDRERRAKQKHLDYLSAICQHGQTNVIHSRRAHQVKAIALGRRIQSFHSQTEKEEQKRIERISKERLRALKADDEEAYLKLIDTAKDTRITHLLRQTDAYLDSLAQAVVSQQNEDGRMSHEAPDEISYGAPEIEDESDDKQKVDYYGIAHKITERVSAQPSMLVGGTLKDYQVKGLQWMVSLYNNRLNGILADEMGLGKTIQTISLITFLIEVKRQPGPYLVIVPLSTITNWTGEFLKWAPSVPMIAYKGSPAARRGLQNELRLGNFQVLLTTYEYIIKDRPILGKIKWLHMTIDEGHRMKNTQSKLAQTLTQFYHTRYRLLLTGTPLQNNLPELWALLNFALPKIFNSVKSFDEWFNTPFASSGASDQIRLNEEESLLVIKRLHKVLRPFLLRRLKKDVESELPDKVEKVIKVKMSALQTQLYRQMKKFKQFASGPTGEEKQVKGQKGLNNELMQLRKICQHPFLFNTVEDAISPGPNVDESLVRTSGKFEMLSRILPKFFRTGHRVLIFFQMTNVMDIMADFLRSMNWNFLRLDGGTKPEDRAEYVALFNDPGSEYKVFILSTRAGGLGLNLQSADTVIIYDSDWNPHADLQAQDRAHRIGQTKAVRILRFISEKSVEEAMFARARFKLGMDEKVIQAGRFDNKSTQEDSEEMLRAILEADNEADDSEESGIMNDDEINDLISRTDEETVIFREMDIEREQLAEEKWRAAGNRGPRPPPLMSLEELPLCWQTDDALEPQDEEERFEGRGARKRQQVNYSDGLTDEQFAMALEEDEDLDVVAEKNRERKERRLALKFNRERGDTPDRKKGKKFKPTDDFDTPTSIKRKRTMKEASVTPSLNDEEEDSRETKRRRTKWANPDSQTMARMKKIFLQVHNAVAACVDETGRKRCDLFKDLPDKNDYPDYYVAIKQPISMNQMKKRVSSGAYKSVTQFREDWQLMFSNARTYNQEGSWVYIDAEEMEKVFIERLDHLTIGSGLPGAEITKGDSGEDVSMTDTPVASGRPSRTSSVRLNVRQIVSDDDEDYLSGSDE